MRGIDQLSPHDVESMPYVLCLVALGIGCAHDDRAPALTVTR